MFAPWERHLLDLVNEEPGDDDGRATVGLQFDLVVPMQISRRPRQPAQIGLRPVLPGKNGNWVRSGISWTGVGYGGSGLGHLPRAQLQLLEEIAALDAASRRSYSYGASPPISLTTFASRRIWDLLDEAHALGMPFVQANKPPSPVVLVAEGAELQLDLTRAPAGMTLRPQLRSGDETRSLESAVLTGNPAHGIAWWSDADGGRGPLYLARLATAVPPSVRTIVDQAELTVPAEQEERFFSKYYPALRQRVPLASSDSSVELPQPVPPTLRLRLRHEPGHTLALAWEWLYRLGESERVEPLWPPAGPDAAARGRVPVDRDLDEEAAVLAPVLPLAKTEPALWGIWHSGGGWSAAGGSRVAGTHSADPRLMPEQVLAGSQTANFVSEVLPQLEKLPGLTIETTGEAAEYRLADAAPVVEISGAAAEGDRDWFDLDVAVTVDGEPVPFEELFVALVTGQASLILPSGTWFSLDTPELQALAALIEEARALQDSPRATVRLNRYQAGLWEELERAGIVDGQAAEWQRSVRALTSVTELPEPPLPTMLDATLRPYQQVGYSWLSFLFDHQLGGILADEMGLGKTLQALALISRAKEQGTLDHPFLVVAPTSVVGNWALECRRFTPDLDVRVVTETKARRRSELADAVAGADVVLTSYTLLRLEDEAYQAIEWGGLVLDEAQFVKNHQSRAHQCAKKLPAPFKLAITGTPMENNLMELWALLSITAPGLFASPTRFEKTYRTPIEKNKDTALLDQLRRRIAPFLLRRSKEAVVKELPAKQEQVVELTLNPKHRKIYQTHLQRERQKVLGLLGDLEKNRFEIFRSLTLLRQASLDVGLIDEEYAGVPSTKLDALVEQLTEIANEGHRTLVFSQFTRFLGAARDQAAAAGLASCYLDGSTRDRPAVLEEFKNGDAPVFFISLKAGGFGLNLTEADYCILLDPWWNPATEAQAVDRAHRIGQTRQVMVYRLVAKDTIEEKVMALKAAKAELFGSVLDGGEFSSAALSADDIRGMLS